MSIVNVYIASDDQPTLEKMAKLLIQKRNIDINAQSKQFVSEEQCNIVNITGNLISELRTTSNTRKDTALHIACQVGARDVVKILLTHPDVKTDIRNCEGKSPKDCIARGFEDTIKLEFEKARRGKQLLKALFSKEIDQAKMLLNEELNPNCWGRMRHGEIVTPLSTIVVFCSEKITEDEKEVLVKFLKHKELDFNQIKSKPTMRERKYLKQTIEQAIKERLIDAINSKDLDDVKKLVEDNCFMNYAIIIAAWRNVNNPVESITNYLNEKFPANTLQPSADTNNVPVDFEQVVRELERTEAQLAEKERELNSVKQEKLNQQTRINVLTNQVTQLTNENAQLRAQNQDLKNEKSSEASASGGRQSNYASAAFVLSGAFAIGACLIVDSYPVASACLAAVALVLLLVGYFLYKGDEKDIGPGSATDNPQVTMFLISSLGPAGNS